MRGRGWTNDQRGHLKRLAVVLGAVSVVAGVAFHGLAASVNPMGDPQLGSADGWAFLQWGWLRATAWAGVFGGTWIAAWGLTARDQPAAKPVGEAL